MCAPSREHFKRYSGIGLRLMLLRLRLLRPMVRWILINLLPVHRLKISKDGTMFIVKMTLLDNAMFLFVTEMAS